MFNDMHVLFTLRIIYIDTHYVTLPAMFNESTLTGDDSVMNRPSQATIQH